MSVFCCLFLAATATVACNQTNECKNCQDIVSQIPWTAPETNRYQLKSGDTEKGRAVLAIEQQGGGYLFTQSFSDDNGNSDASKVTAAGTTLKPITQTRTIIDKDLRKTVDSAYESVAKDQCDGETIARIKQTTYSPPDADEPSSERSNPLCVPPHAYDNDESLFIWRTITFEKGYNVRYQTVLTGRRETQIVELTVKDQVSIDVPAGRFDTWLVFIQADQRTQQAWFAVTPDHTLIRYNNDTLDFLLID